MKHEYGLQMYSVRDLTDKNLEKALDIVADLGYTSVEFAGFFGHSAEEVNGYLKKTGLRISGTHSGVEGLFPENIDGTVAYHKAIGNRDYIIPGARLNTTEQMDDFVRVVNAAQPKLEDAGIRLGYHNHSGEFQTMYWGTTILSELERRTGLHFEIDTYWAFNAGTDPVEVLKRFRNRIHVIHLKDGFPGGRGMALGEGIAPVLRVREYALEHNLAMVVESETLCPTGEEEVGRCIRFLRSLE